MIEQTPYVIAQDLAQVDDSTWARWRSEEILTPSYHNGPSLLTLIDYSPQNPDPTRRLR